MRKSQKKARSQPDPARPGPSRESNRALDRSITDGSQEENSQSDSEGGDKSKRLFKKAVADCVRLVLMKAGSQKPISMKDLKDVMSKNQRAHMFMPAAIKILKEVYGYNVELCDHSQATKYYAVANEVCLNGLLSYIGREPQKPATGVLTLLVLSHILMSNEVCTDGSLNAFLAGLGISMDRKHPLFGNVSDHINGTLVKNKMLEMETDTTSNKAHYRWGAKAENTVSKMKVLNFVAKMYKKPATHWPALYKIAQQHDAVFQQNAEVATE